MKSAKSVIACLKQRGIFWHQLSLQFRLSSAPRVLTEILTLLLGLMRTQDVYVAWFLDDLLLKDSSAGLKAMNFSANIQRMIPFLQTFNWFPKSALQSSYCLDTTQARIFLSLENIASLGSHMWTLRSKWNL